MQSTDVMRAAALIARGNIVCIPTETTYGLAVDIRRPRALAKLVELKGRSPESPFPLIAKDIDSARSLASAWHPAADALAAHAWPGALTLVIPARADLPAELIGPSGGVGVRVSSCESATAVAREVGAPITATSANPAGAEPARSVDEARAYFRDAVAFYLDGGKSSFGASTVVEVAADGTVRLLRKGVVALPELEGS